MDNHEYRTNDTALAGYLITAGYILQSIDYSSAKYDFVFDNTNGITERAFQYTIGKAKVDPVAYTRVFRTLMRLMRLQKQWGEE